LNTPLKSISSLLFLSSSIDICYRFGFIYSLQLHLYFIKLYCSAQKIKKNLLVFLFLIFSQKIGFNKPKNWRKLSKS